MNKVARISWEKQGNSSKYFCTTASSGIAALSGKYVKVSLGMATLQLHVSGWMTLALRQWNVWIKIGILFADILSELHNF